MRNSEGKGGEEITIEVREQQWADVIGSCGILLPILGKIR